jgi:hypothetical protein
MNWNRRLRMVRIPAVGAAAVVGVVGAALLAGPLTGAQASQYPESYWNGGFCYLNPNGQENMYRLQFDEVAYSPEYPAAVFSWKKQEWDTGSNQYHDIGAPFGQWGADKHLLETNGGYSDPNEFCKAMTSGEVSFGYSYGEWTSRREADPSSSSSSAPPQP